MAELEKVILGLECQYEPRMTCYGCEYFIARDKLCNKNKIFREAVDLLKAQEPVKPYIDYDGQDVWRCGSCGATIFHLSHTQADENEQNCVTFCRYCGKAMKWE
jgi:hypothetical protein